MTVDEVEALARRAAPGQGFVVIDVSPRPGSNQPPTAFAPFGDDIPDRLGHGPIAFQFTDRPDAEATFRQVSAAMDEERGLIAGTLTLVTAERTTAHTVD